MLMNLFLWPGRRAAGFLSNERKKNYRSRRDRFESPGILALLSLGLWLAGAGVLLFALDRTDLLKKALDAGVEAAQGEIAPEPAPLPPLETPPEPVETTAESTLAAPESSAAGSQAAAAMETEMWLVILHSIPKTGRAEAERRQAGYKAKGLEVDILDTSAFPRLPPNYWIIALGPFDTRAEALTASDRAKAFNFGLMVRRGL